MSLYTEALARTINRTLQPDYKGCALHLQVQLGMRDGEPKILSYYYSDWSDSATIATIVDGKVIWQSER